MHPSREPVIASLIPKCSTRPVIVITGTDTDIGKTVFAAGLTESLGAYYWKPVQAGTEGGTDSEVVARLTHIPPGRILPEAYRLVTPASPHLAARIDGVEIDLEKLTIPKIDEKAEVPLVVECAGGVLVPLTERFLFADMMTKWQTPVIVCARSGLGTINHSLMTVETLRSRGVQIAGIVFIGERHEENERIVPKLAGVPSLGRLPVLSPLNADTLKKAMRDTIDLERIREAMKISSQHDALGNTFLRNTSSAGKNCDEMNRTEQPSNRYERSPIWHPFTQHGLEEIIPMVTRGEGPLLHCADGTTLIDGISSWWVTTHGHCHPRIMAAIAQQTRSLDQVIFAGYTHKPAEEVARGLIEIAPPGLTRVFFSDSGSTSVEVALKMALGYWHNRKQSRHRILVLEHSYHGDTIGAMSVGERGVFNRPYAPLLFDVGTIPFPGEAKEQKTLEALESACANQEKPVAAFIVEPLILGAGGMLIYKPEILRAMRDICKRHAVLFIADEVMTGWGRTGTLCACEQAGISPDIMCLSKGLTGGSIPLAVTLATEAIFDAHYSTDRANMFYHSSSYTANPLACAAAAANLAIWREEDVAGRIAVLSKRMQMGMAKLEGHPAFENLRQIGVIAALDVKTTAANVGYHSDLAPRLRAFFLQRGILLRPLGNTIYVMPPYSIREDQLGKIFSAIAEAGYDCINPQKNPKEN